MKIVAASDIHLGFSHGSAVKDGRNQRELDVEKAWFEFVQRASDMQPDLIVIPGDIVHHPRVSDHAKWALLGGLQDLLMDTQAHVVLLAGNHDVGKTASVMAPLFLANIVRNLTLDAAGVARLHVVGTPKRLDLVCGNVNCSVSCFPYVALAEKANYKLEPNPAAHVNVLLMHAAVKGAEDGDRLPFFYGASDQALDVGREADRWDMIVVGDYHELTKLHPTRPVFYPGALERTTSNIWQEDADKGFVSYDTDLSRLEFHKVATRPMYNFVLGEGELFMDATADGVNLALQALSMLDFLDDAMVRLKVDDFPLEEKQHIDRSLVSELKRRCTYFYLDLRYAQREVADIGDRRDRGDGLSLAQEAVAFFADDEEDVRRSAFRYLEIEADVEEVA